MIEHRDIASYIMKSPITVMLLLGSTVFNILLRMWVHGGESDPHFTGSIIISGIVTYFMWGAYSLFTNTGKLPIYQHIEYRVVKIELTAKDETPITVYRTQERCRFPYGWGVWNDVQQSPSISESTFAFDLARELRAELSRVVRKLMLSTSGPERKVTVLKEEEKDNGAA